MSSPSRNTSGSRRLSSAIASRSASPIVSRRTAATASGIDIRRRVAGLGKRRIARELDRVIELGLHLCFKMPQGGLVQTRAEDEERISRRPAGFLLPGPVPARVTAAVPGEPVGLAF